MDIRELWGDLEETLETVLDGFRKKFHAAKPVIVAQDGDGQKVTLQSAVKGINIDGDGKSSFVDLPLLSDIPVAFAGGGGVTATHPVKKGDEGIVLFSSRPIDSWFQSGGVQNPIDARQHSLSDGFYVPSVRSTPRKLANVSNEAHHVRSDDAKVTHEVHPTTGIKSKTVDPSWNDPGNGSTNPFNAATKFFESLLHPSNGIAHNATDGGTTHSITNDHTSGSKLSAANGAHVINAHPENGATISSSSGSIGIGGLIESAIEGFKFPDGSVQMSAAIAPATFSGGSSAGGSVDPTSAATAAAMENLVADWTNFTPALASAPTAGATFTVNAAAYNKVGAVLFLQLDFTCNTTVGGATYPTVDGLPLAANGKCVLAAHDDNAGIMGGFVIDGGAAGGKIVSYGNLTPAPLAAGSRWVVTGFYRVAP